MRGVVPLTFALMCLPGPLLLNAQDPRFSSKLAPYVASPVRVVDLMLDIAKVKPGETVIDLGCGDGRILVAAAGKYKAKAIGIEISPKLVSEAKARIAKEGLIEQVQVIQGDLLQADLTGADVVTIYLDTAVNTQLRPRLEKYLKPGARVVSHDFQVPGWKPTRVDKSEGKQGHFIYLYEMPPIKQ